MAAVGSASSIMAFRRAAGEDSGMSEVDLALRGPGKSPLTQ